MDNSSLLMGPKLLFKVINTKTLKFLDLILRLTLDRRNLSYKRIMILIKSIIFIFKTLTIQTCNIFHLTSLEVTLILLECKTLDRDWIIILQEGLFKIIIVWISNSKNSSISMIWIRSSSCLCNNNSKRNNITTKGDWRVRLRGTHIWKREESTRKDHR